MKKTQVTVLLPVYNLENYISEAIKSILNQSYRNFELIIINDCSTDQTLKIIKSFKDKRVILINNPKNIGIARSLNKGLKKSQGEYILRCDGDDINLPNRLELQLKFMQQNPEYLIVGSDAWVIDQRGKKTKTLHFPRTDSEVRKVIYSLNPFKLRSFLNNPVLHPAMLIKASFLHQIGGYNPEFNIAEDYDLVFKALKSGKVCNLPQKLIFRRFFKQAVTQKLPLKRDLMTLFVKLSNLPLINKIGLDFIIGIFVFLIYRCWLVFLTFQNRVIPPEPDDSYFYLAAAKIFPSIQSFEQFRLFLYSAWISGLANLTNLNFEKAYQLNFYLGTILLFLGLIYFIRSFEKNIFMRILLLIFLGLYTGSGAYHGFYWVVPSFYQVLLFFLLAASLKNQQTKLTILLSIIFIFIHPASILIFACLLLFIITKQLISPNKVQLKLITIFTSTNLLSFLVYTILGNRFNQQFSPESPLEILAIVQPLIKGQINLVSWPVIYHEYFFFLTVYSFITVGFLICLFFCFQKNKDIFLLYLSTLVIVLFSAVVPYGYRTLGFLWPLTFIVFAYGLLGLFEQIKRFSFNWAFSISSLALISFFLLASLLNFIWINSVTINKNYSWNKQCPVPLNEIKTNQPIIFSSLESFNAFVTNGFDSKLGQVQNQNQILKPGQLIVQNINISSPVTQMSGISGLITKYFTRKDPAPVYSASNSYWNNTISKNDQNTKLIRDCGYFQILQIN